VASDYVGSRRFLLGAVGKAFRWNTDVVQISTVFGEDPGYWTLAPLGTHQHAMFADYEMIERIHALHLSG
jgi:hypothetical protein